MRCPPEASAITGKPSKDQEEKTDRERNSRGISSDTWPSGALAPADDRRGKTKVFRFDQHSDALKAAEEYRQRMAAENGLLRSDQ